MLNEVKNFIDTIIREDIVNVRGVYQPDLDNDDLALEYTKYVISLYLAKALEEGVKELVISGELPEDGPDTMVQDQLDDLIPRLQKYIAGGNLPVI